MFKVEQLYQTAYDLDRKGMTIDAIDKYQEVISADPKHIPARVRLAYIYRMIGGYVSMKRELKAAMEQDLSETAIVFDDVFFGQEKFQEYELYRGRTLKNISLWGKELEQGWNITKREVDDYVLLSVENEEGIYSLGLPVDAEMLIFKKTEDCLQYLLTRRKYIDGSYYNFLCRFREGRQFRSGDINNYTKGTEVFSSYMNTFLKELEIVF